MNPSRNQAMECIQCQHELRDGAAFCGACGARQPERHETPDAVARYRAVMAKFLGDGGLNADKLGQLDALRLRLSVSLATHAALLAELEPASPPPLSVRLAVDVATFKYFEVGARCLVRLKLENEGPLALETAALSAMLSGAPLPPVEATTIFPGRAALFPLAVTPSVAGFHELAGELRLVDLMGEGSVYRFSDVHLRIGGEGPRVQVVNIDQSSARVVDNSRSSFGATDSAGGLVSEGDWQPIALQAVRVPAASTHLVASSTNRRRAEFAVHTEQATYQVTSTLAHGDISTVYGGHVRGSVPPVQIALKIADAAGDNDLLQHEARVLGLLASDAPEDKAARHLPRLRDQFRTTDGRMGSVFEHLDGFDLTQVRDRCRKRGEPGLPERHLVWLMRRSFAALGWAHKHGIVHGNLEIGRAHV